MNSVFLFKLTWLVIINLFNSANGEIYAECENMEEGTFIPGLQGCKSYIYCEGDESYEGMCPSQLLFNTKDGSCAPEDEVECNDGVTTVASTEAETTTTTTTTSTTTTTVPTTLATPEPTEEEIVQPVTEPTTKPSEPVTSDVQTTPNSIRTTTAGSISTSSPGQICPASDDPHAVVLLPSETSCSEYFICYHGTPVRMSCSGQLLFDDVTSKCELPNRVNCKVETPTTPNPKTECVHNTYDFFPYPKNCNYFYKCMNGFLSLQQCPVGFGWSEEMKLCLKLEHGRCPTRAAGQLQNESWLNNIYSV